jgi:hypothetical protein
VDGSEGILRGAAQKKKGQKKGRLVYKYEFGRFSLSIDYVLHIIECCVVSHKPTAGTQHLHNSPLFCQYCIPISLARGAALQTRKKGRCPAPLKIPSLVDGALMMMGSGSDGIFAKNEEWDRTIGPTYRNLSMSEKTNHAPGLRSS